MPVIAAAVCSTLYGQLPPSPSLFHGRSELLLCFQLLVCKTLLLLLLLLLATCSIVAVVGAMVMSANKQENMIAEQVLLSPHPPADPTRRCGAVPFSMCAFPLHLSFFVPCSLPPCCSRWMT